MTHRTMSERSYHGATSRSWWYNKGCGMCCPVCTMVHVFVDVKQMLPEAMLPRPV